MESFGEYMMEKFKEVWAKYETRDKVVAGIVVLFILLVIGNVIH